MVNGYFQQNTPDGVNLYFNLLNDAKKAYEANRLKEAEALRYRGYQGEIPEPAGWSAVCGYVLRLQIRVLDKNNKQWVYPAPLPLQNTQFDPNKHGKLPLFYHSEPELFWLKKYDKFRRVGESYGIN